MIPKKAKTLYKGVSEDLDLSLDLVEDFVEFYYKNARQKMSNLEGIRYDLEGLGHVYTRNKVVKNTIIKNNNIIENAKKETFSQYHNLKSVEEQNKKLKKIADLMEKATMEKFNFFNKKYNGDFKTNMEEPETDN